MKVGWQVFSLFNQVADERLTFVSPCGKCLKSSYFPTSGLIKLVGSYVNIAEFVDIICCCLSVTRFTMVFGKFFAFLASKNKSYCIYKCLKG